MSSLRVMVPGSRSPAGISALAPRCHARFRAAAGSILTSGSRRQGAHARRPHSTSARSPAAAAAGSDGERDSSQPPAEAGHTAQESAEQPRSSKLHVLWQLVRQLAGPVAVLACAWLAAQLPFAGPAKLALSLAWVCTWLMCAWLVWRFCEGQLDLLADGECARLCADKSPAVLAAEQRQLMWHLLRRCPRHLYNALLCALYVHFCHRERNAADLVAFCVALILILPDAYDAWHAYRLARAAQRAAAASGSADGSGP